MSDTANVTVDITAAHEEKKTLSEDFYVAAHGVRTETELFRSSRDMLLAIEGGRCFVSNDTEDEAGGPLECHHWLVERKNAEIVDWEELKRYVFGLERHIARAAYFLREHMDGPPDGDILNFVDNAMANGMLLAKRFHVCVGTGIHNADFPNWAAQAYGRDGFQLTPTEVIAHADVTAGAPTGTTVDVTVATAGAGATVESGG